MPKAAASTLVWLPERGTYALRAESASDSLLLTDDEAEWFAWLERHSSFAFRGKSGSMNLLKEARKGGAGYWYAYRRHGRRTAKQYAGKSADLSIARLEALAAALARGPHPLAEATPAPLNMPDYRSDDPSTSAGPADWLDRVPLLAAKLRPPRLHTDLVQRRRLLDRLDDGLARKLTLISAPAGFGKTTLVRQWLESVERRAQSVEQAHDSSALRSRLYAPCVAWVALDAGDNDPLRFWRYIISACRDLQADSGQAALALLARTPNPPFEPMPLQPMLTAFLNQVTVSAQGGILVLEDFHAITSQPIHITVGFIIDHLPATLHLMILTRADPPLSLVRLRAGGDLCEVRRADLRFSPAETSAFFQRALPAPLPAEAIQRLDAQLEGWAAGLRLLSLTLRGRESQQDVEQVLASLAGSHRSILEYFVGEVLSAQPAEIQMFLLQTSILTRLSGPLCDTLTGRRDGEALLGAMDRANLFLEPLDGQGAWYRYHALFAEAMQQEALRRLGDAALRGLSLKASFWYEQHGLLAEALEVALQAQALDRATELIERIVGAQPFTSGPAQFDQIGEFHTLRRWLERLPDTVIRQRPALCLSYATALLFIVVADRDSPAIVQRIEAVLEMAEQGFRATGNVPQLAVVFAFRAMFARWRGAVREAVTWASQALAWLPATELMWRGASVGALGIGELYAGRLDAALAAVLEARAISEAIGNPSFVRANTGLLCAVYVERGELHLAATHSRHMLAEAREQADRDDIGRASLTLALLAYEWNDLDAAEKMAREGAEMAEQLANEPLQAQAEILLARVQQARGQGDAALGRLTAFLPQLQPYRSPLHARMARELMFWQASFQLAAGDLVAAQRWADARTRDETLPVLQYAAEERLVARLLIAQDRAEAAISVLGRLPETAQQAGHARGDLEMQALLALAHAARKQLRQSRQQVWALLAWARAEGYLRLFLDEGAPMAALLRASLPHIREQPLSDYLRSILNGFALPPAAGAPAGSLAALSPQEQRVLDLLASGRTNPEIAQALVVSVNTVRTHVQSIYRKLGVDNRVAASHIARQLGLQSSKG